MHKVARAQQQFADASAISTYELRQQIMVSLQFANQKAVRHPIYAWLAMHLQEHIVRDIFNELRRVFGGTLFIL